MQKVNTYVYIVHSIQGCSFLSLYLGHPKRHCIQTQSVPEDSAHQHTTYIWKGAILNSRVILGLGP